MPDFGERDRYCIYCQGLISPYDGQSVCDDCEAKLRGPFAKPIEWAVRVASEAPTMVTTGRHEGKCWEFPQGAELTVGYDHYREFGWTIHFGVNAADVSWWVGHRDARGLEQSYDTEDIPYSRPDFYEELLRRVNAAWIEVQRRRNVEPE